MISLCVPRFTSNAYALHERICFTVGLVVRETPRLPVELRCSYSEGDTEQLLECVELDAMRLPGIYRAGLALGPPAVCGRRDGILFVRAYYGGAQFQQYGFFVHSGRAQRTLCTERAYEVHNHAVWRQ